MSLSIPRYIFFCHSLYALNVALVAGMWFWVEVVLNWRYKAGTIKYIIIIVLCAIGVIKQLILLSWFCWHCVTSRYYIIIVLYARYLIDILILAATKKQRYYIIMDLYAICVKKQKLYYNCSLRNRRHQAGTTHIILVLCEIGELW